MNSLEKEGEHDMNMSTMRDEFRSAITRLVEITPSADQASACTTALEKHLHTIGAGGINREYALSDFRCALDNGHPLVERCMDWWDELLFDIRYPVAYCHVVTGTLPGGYVSHTIAAISVYDRDGKPLAHDMVEWADFASTELTDKESYGGFCEAIRKAVVRLGARSMFKFIDCVLHSSVSIFHDPEQGPSWFREQTYGKREEDTTADPVAMDQKEDWQATGLIESDFFGSLKRLRKEPS